VTAGPANDNQETLDGVRVLVAEDDPFLLIDLERMLRSAGATIVGLCRTLEEALERAGEADFAVAVLDFRLGSDTVSPVARLLDDRGVPFVLYTAQPRHEPAMAAWRDAVVEKPAPPPVLLGAVRAALGGRVRSVRPPS
jgi:CheY-like chemotaxis protein